MHYKLEKQPENTLLLLMHPHGQSLYKALDKLRNLEGDIVRLRGTDRLYRLKVEHYRIIFRYNGDGEWIIVETIDTGGIVNDAA